MLFHQNGYEQGILAAANTIYHAYTLSKLHRTTAGQMQEENNGVYNTCSQGVINI
jgi:hypothetical protein